MLVADVVFLHVAGVASTAHLLPPDVHSGRPVPNQRPP